MIDSETHLNRRQFLALGAETLVRSTIAFGLIRRGARCINPRETETMQQCRDITDATFTISGTTREEYQNTLQNVVEMLPGDQSDRHMPEIPNALIDRGFPALSLGFGAILATRTLLNLRNRLTTPNTEQPTN